MIEDKGFFARLVDVFVYSTLGLFALATLLPFLFVLAGSITAPEELLAKGIVLIPTQFSFEAYQYIFSTDTLMRSLLVTIFLTIAGTAVNLIFTILMAYPLARTNLMGRRWIMLMIIFSMVFSGGMIPTFLIVKTFGMIDSYWSLLIPTAINAFNLIILKSFFQRLPEGLEESAKIDGCNDMGILVRIVIPLSMPAIATFSLFYAVGHWNTFFNAILYLNKSEMWPIQVLLRQIVILSDGGIGDSSSFDEGFVPPSQTVKMAVIVVSTIPMLLVYPFLQKHFAKGVLLGSVKG
jgi:putative aldouronate transport system permease protein